MILADAQTDSEEPSFEFLVPDVAGKNQNTVVVPRSTSYKEGMDILYKSVKCGQVLIKPKFGYRLKETAKLSTNINCADDWARMRKEAKKVEKIYLVMEDLVSCPNLQYVYLLIVS